MTEPRSSDAETFTAESNTFSSSDRHRQGGLVHFQINQFSSAPFRQDGSMDGIFQTRIIDSGERVIKIGDDDDDFVVPVCDFNSQISTESETIVPSSPSSNFQAIEFQTYLGKDPKSPYPLTILTASSSGHGYLKGSLSDDNSIESISDPFGTMMTDKTQELNECGDSDQHLHDEPIIQSCRDMSSTEDIECENMFVDYYESGKESISKPTTCSSFGIKDDSFMMESSVDRESNISKTSMTCSSFGMMTISPDDVVRLIGQKNFWKMRMTIANQQRIFVGQLFELHRLIKVQKLFATTIPRHILQGHGTTTFGNSLPVKPPSLPSEPDPLNPPRGRMHVFSEEHNPGKSLGRGDPPIYQRLPPSDGLVYKPVSGSDRHGKSYAPSAPSAAVFRIRPCHILPSNHTSVDRYVPEKGRQLGDMVSRGGSSSTVVTCAEPGDVTLLQQSSTSKQPKERIHE